MIPADDEAVRAEVSAANRVPQCFARSSHSHCQRQERKQHSMVIVVVLGHYAVRPDASEVVYVARLCQSDNWMKEKRPVNFARGTCGQFFVGTVQRVSRLERDDVRETERRESFTYFRWRKSQSAEIVVARQLQDTYFPRDA